MKKRKLLEQAISVCTLTVGVYVLFVAILRSPRFAGDTVAMTQSAQLLVNCAKSGKFLGCPGTNQYGLLQNIPAIFLAWKGLSLEGIVAILGFLNLGAYVALLTILWRSFKGRLRYLSVLVMLAGPLVGYVSLTFGEMLQTFVFVAFVVALVRKHWLWAFVAALLAASTRETAFLPLLMIAAGTSIVAFRGDRHLLRKSAFVAGSGVACGVVLITLFNYWKFGTWKNLGNLNSAYVTPGLAKKLDSFLAIWFAPGGGVAPFWFIGAVCSLGILILIISTGNRVERFGALLVGAGLGANTASLAMWFAPFGWVAWGPRLMIPTVGCVVAANFLIFGERIDALLERPTRWLNPMATLVTCVSVVSAAASYGYLRSPSSIDKFFVPDNVCKKVAIIQEDPAYYFMCLHHGAWKTSPSLWSTGLDGLESWGFGAVLCLAVALWMTLITRGSVQSESVDVDLLEAI